jgi:hypothetical protein
MKETTKVRTTEAEQRRKQRKYRGLMEESTKII